MNPHQTALAGAEIREDSGADSSVSPPAGAPIAASGTSRPVEQPPAEDDARQRSSAGMNAWPTICVMPGTEHLLALIHEKGACRGAGVDMFPTRGQDIRSARAVCASCSVADECLEYALRNREAYGVWGGKSERERRKLRVGLPVRIRRIDHGSPGGAAAHRGRGELPCSLCRQAESRAAMVRRKGVAS